MAIVHREPSRWSLGLPEGTTLAEREPHEHASGSSLGPSGARSGAPSEYVALGFVFVADELDPQTVASLLARARAGDSQAFAAIYDAYAGRLYRFLMLRVREPADAEDLLQRVFVNVIEALPRYQDRGLPFGAWLFRIARNVAIDFARARPHDDALTVVADHHEGVASRRP